MEQEIGIVDAKQASICKQAPHMLLQAVADHERVMELVYEFLLFLSQLVRVFGVDGREVCVAHFIFIPVDGQHALFIIDFPKLFAV